METEMVQAEYFEFQLKNGLNSLKHVNIPAVCG